MPAEGEAASAGEERRHRREVEEGGHGARRLAAEVGVGARLEEGPHDVLPLPEHRGADRGLPAVVDAGVVGAPLEEQPDDRLLRVVGGEDQQGVAGVVREVDGEAAVEPTGELRRAPLAGVVEGGAEEGELVVGECGVHPGNATASPRRGEHGCAR